MVSKRVSVFPLPIILLLLILTSTAAAPQASARSSSTPPTATPIPIPALVQQTCKSTKYYDLCVSALRSDPASPTADTKGLALIMVGVAVANATATSSFLSSLVSSTFAGTDPATAKLLKECSDKYSMASSSLQDSAEDLTAESYDDAYIHIMAGRDYPNACHNAFKRVKGAVYPTELARREDGLKRICDVALGIVDILASSQQK